MSQSKRTKYVLQSAAVLGLAGVVGLSIAATPGSPALKADAASSSFKQTTPPEGGEARLDDNTYARATSVRRNASLTDQDLAALGLDQEQAEAVLLRLVEWCEAKGAELDRAQQSLRSAERAVAELERSVRIGTATARDIQQLPDIRAERHAAETSLDNILGRVAAHALQGQLPSVVGAWEQARGHDRSIRGELRYLPVLNDARLQTLRTTAGRSGGALEDELMFDEKQQLQLTRQKIQANLPGVVAATDKVMPNVNAAGLLLDDERLSDE